jgi:hypothetical protein
MALQKEYEFCDASSVIEDNNSVVLGDVLVCRAQKNAWGTAINKELGGMTFVAEVTTTLNGAGTLDVALTANTTNTLVSGTELLKVHFASNAAAGTVQRMTIPPGISAGNYLGVVGITTGAIDAGNINAYLAIDKGQKAD